MKYYVAGNLLRKVFCCNLASSVRNKTKDTIKKHKKHCDYLKTLPIDDALHGSGPS